SVVGIFEWAGSITERHPHSAPGDADYVREPAMGERGETAGGFLHAPTQGDGNVHNTAAARSTGDVGVIWDWLGPSELLPILDAILGRPDVGVGTRIEFLAVQRTGNG